MAIHPVLRTVPPLLLALAIGASSAQAAPLSASALKAKNDNMCTDAGTMAKGLGGGGASGVRRTSGPATRTTLYLPDAAYAVRRCSPAGRFEGAKLYELRTTTKDRQEYVLGTSIEPRPDGSLTTTHLDYISPADPQAEQKWAAAHKSGPTVEPPDDARLLTDKQPQPPAPRQSRSQDPAKCFNNSYNTIVNWPNDANVHSWWPARGYTYYTNLWNASWDNLVGGGMATIDGRWNSCGFAINPRTASSWGGSVPGATFNPDDTMNVVTIGGAPQISQPRPTGCGAGASTLACQASRAVWAASPGPGGQNVQVLNSDILFNADHCWADGAIPGCYDVWSVAAHEFGHAYGLGHVSGGSYDYALIMYPTSNPGTAEGRYNAQGDLTGIGVLYP